MHSETRDTATSKTDVLEIYLYCDSEKYESDFDSNQDGWLAEQAAEVADFESKNPQLELVTGAGNSILYRGTAEAFENAGIGIMYGE